MRWLPDGKRLLVCGNPPSAPSRSFVLDPATKQATPVGAEGAWVGVPSPDGKRFATRSMDGWMLCSFADSTDRRPIPGLTPADEVIRWSPDGAALFCFRRGEVPCDVDRIELPSGRRSTVTVVGDRDQAGLVSVLSVTLADDLRTLAYAKWYYTSTLFTATGSRRR